MNILVRADSSVTIGTGHVMRCMTLAHRLTSIGHSVTFYMKNLEGHIGDYVHNQGFNVVMADLSVSDAEKKWTGYQDWLKGTEEDDANKVVEWIQHSKTTFDWVIVDHYALGAKWEELVRPQVQRVFAIDDIANRSHRCDVLLDQNILSQADPYMELLLTPTTRLYGPSYALLRDEFTLKRNRSRRQLSPIDRILIFFGGSDLTNQTEKSLEAIVSLEDFNVDCDVILGLSNPRRNEIRKKWESHHRIHFHERAKSMSTLMMESQLALGSGGTITWERSCLGLPSLVISVAENQRNISKHVGDSGATHYLGHFDEVTSDDIAKAIHAYRENPELLKTMSEKAKTLVDGLGTERASSYFLSDVVQK